MSKAQSLIEQFYLEEQERQAAEASFTPVDLTISSGDLAMLTTIAKRFNKDKSLLVREVLSQALIDTFLALDPVERKMLAKEADELANSIATEIAEEQGLNEVEASGTNWVQQEKTLAKEERKAEKTMAELKAKIEEEVRAELAAEQAEETVADELPSEAASNEMDVAEASSTESAFEATEATSEEAPVETEQNSIFA